MAQRTHIRMANEIDRLIDLLEDEPLWQARNSLPAEAQAHIGNVAEQIEILRTLTTQAKALYASFEATKTEYLLKRDQGTPTREEFPGFQKIVDGALATSVPFNLLQPNLRNVVNVFRRARGALPLDGSEHTSN
ncbi:hypothetical protein ASF71_16725 [Deinococcus sp. Leaf326]|nr:hypothetical protein ASF71_16725 [Deinococcus sp. Leaf326]